MMVNEGLMFAGFWANKKAEVCIRDPVPRNTKVEVLQVDKDDELRYIGRGLIMVNNG